MNEKEVRIKILSYKEWIRQFSLCELGEEWDRVRKDLNPDCLIRNSDSQEKDISA